MQSVGMRSLREEEEGRARSWDRDLLLLLSNSRIRIDMSTEFDDVLTNQPVVIDNVSSLSVWG